MEIYNGTYIVYCHENKINGKKYIGMTKMKLSERSGSDGVRYKNSPCFYNAIKKYKWTNFCHIIIASNLTKKEAQNFERLLIKKLKTQNNKYGYNIANGGEGGNQKKLIPIRQYDLKGEYIKTFKSASDASKAVTGTSERRSAIISCCRKRIKQAYGFIWRYADDLSPNKYEGKNNKEVDKYDLKGNFIKTFNSITEAAKTITIKSAECGISRCCRGVEKSSGGYKWTFHDIGGE